MKTFRCIASASDPPATKYCFRVQVRLVDTVKNKPIGVFTAYNYNVRVIKDVEHACSVFSQTRESLQCCEAELTLLEECTVEVTNDIFYARVLDDDSDSGDP